MADLFDDMIELVSCVRLELETALVTEDSLELGELEEVAEAEVLVAS